MSRSLLLVSTAAGALLAAPPVAARTQAGASDQTETSAAPAEADVVVVGSQIKGSSIAATLPVTVVDQTAIVNTGAVSGDELFRAIPQMGDVTFNASYLPNSSNAARGDVGSVNLRNLGVGNSLVLLNGRRVVNHPTSRADDNLVPVLTANTNAIPVFGIERLEVLRDGAAAIYGSDAVAGVVNIVLRGRFEGLEVEGQVGWAEGTNLIESSINGVGGINLGDRGNVTLYASYTRRTTMRSAEQDYTASADKRALFAGTRFAGATSLDGRSTITPWGSFQTVGNTAVRAGSTSVTNASGQFHIQPRANGGCSLNIPGTANCIDDGVNTAAGDRNLRFDANSAFNTTVIPGVTRINVFATGDYDLTDGVELFGEGGYYRADSRSIQASTGTLSSGPLVIPASNYYNPFGPVTLNGAANPNRIPGTNVPAAGLPVTLTSYNFADAGPNRVDVENWQFRALAGLRFRALGFDWETAALYSEAKVTDVSDGISQTLLQRQQRHVGEHEARAADAPDDFAPDSIRQIPQEDQSRDSCQAHRPKRECGGLGGKPDFDQILGLMHLHGVPDIQAGKVAAGDPPKARGADRARQRPVDRHPLRVDDVRCPRRCASAAGDRIAIWFQSEIRRAPADQKVQRAEHHQHGQAQHPAGRAPVGLLDVALQQRQHQDRTDTNPGKADADRQAAPANEPGRQHHRLAGEAQHYRAAANQQAQRHVDVPGFAGQRCEQQAGAHHEHAAFHDHSRTAAVHQPPEHRTEYRRDQKTE